MSTYVIVNIEVTDPAPYEEYKRLAAPTVAQYDGRYIVRGGSAEQLEGTWIPNRVVVLEFPSVARAKAWFDSPEYAPARKIRHGAAVSDMILVEGV
jgi:uncharacterized protein (DUF1330 family)